MSSFKWTVPSIIAFVAPWQEKVSSVALVSNYYQPSLNIVSGLLSSMAAIAAIAYSHKLAQYKLKRGIITSLVAFTLLILGCYTLYQTVDITYSPSETEFKLLRVIWPIIYSGIFICFSICLALSAILLNKYKEKAG